MHEHSLFTVQIIPVINHLKCFVREHKKFIAPLFPCTIDISGRICFLLLNKNKINKKNARQSKRMDGVEWFYILHASTYISGKMEWFCRQTLSIQNFLVLEVFIPFLCNYPWCISVSLFRIKDIVRQLRDLCKQRR